MRARAHTHTVVIVVIVAVIIIVVIIITNLSNPKLHPLTTEGGTCNEKYKLQ
jgi:flagellar biosynthesis/type III secretory pathway M-ring protein FliF/YscJ